MSKQELCSQEVSTSRKEYDDTVKEQPNNNDFSPSTTDQLAENHNSQIIGHSYSASLWYDYHLWSSNS